MPFGVKSRWDSIFRVHLQGALFRVTNAFRREVPLGPAARRIVTAAAIAASPMPFGVKSRWDRKSSIKRHMLALRSPMPFGVKSRWDRSC